MPVFDLKRPCIQCPFRTDGARVPLRPGRAAEIIANLVERGESFPCHKTMVHGEEGLEVVISSQVCAGAMILLTAINQPNKIMQIGEWMGLFDPTALDPGAPACRTIEEFLALHGADLEMVEEISSEWTSDD